MVCFMFRFNSFSPGQKAIHVGITRGFMKAPGFRPSLGSWYSRYYSAACWYLKLCVGRRYAVGRSIYLKPKEYRNTSIHKSQIGNNKILIFLHLPSREARLVMTLAALTFIQVSSTVASS